MMDEVMCTYCAQLNTFCYHVFHFHSGGHDVLLLRIHYKFVHSHVTSQSHRK